MAKRDHLKDYRLNDEGAYEYRGVLWKWGGAGKDAFLRSVAPAAAVGAAALLALGFMPLGAHGSSFYVLVPYAVAMIGAIMCTFSLGRIAREADPMRDHIYRAGVERLPLACIPGCIGSVLAAAGCAAFALVGGGQGVLPWLACVVMALAAACFWRIRALAIATELTVVEGDAAALAAAQEGDGDGR